MNSSVAKQSLCLICVELANSYVILISLSCSCKSGFKLGNVSKCMSASFCCRTKNFSFLPVQFSWPVSFFFFLEKNPQKINCLHSFTSPFPRDPSDVDVPSGKPNIMRSAPHRDSLALSGAHYIISKSLYGTVQALLLCVCVCEHVCLCVCLFFLEFSPLQMRSLCSNAKEANGKECVCAHAKKSLQSPFNLQG